MSFQNPLKGIFSRKAEVDPEQAAFTTAILPKVEAELKAGGYKWSIDDPSPRRKEIAGLVTAELGRKYGNKIDRFDEGDMVDLINQWVKDIGGRSSYLRPESR